MSETPPSDASSPTGRMELPCPACDYNLRGLPNGVVTCPECGLSLDLRRLDPYWQRRSWYATTAFGVIILPTFFAVLGGIVVFVTLRWLDPAPLDPMRALTVLVTLLSVIVVGWSALMVRVGRRFRAWWAVFAALGFHLVALCYLLGLALFPVGLLVAGAGGLASDWSLLASLLVATVAAVVVLAAARGAERTIGRRCMRHEQWRRTRPGHEALPARPAGRAGA